MGEKFTADAGQAASIKVALEGLALLYRMDRSAERAEKPKWLSVAGLAPGTEGSQ
jgi:hypothetical protein